MNDKSVEMLHIAVTGSRKGPVTLRQLESFVNVFGDMIGIRRATMHHGDCIGWDAKCHYIARALGVSVIIHPPWDGRYRAFCEGAIFWHERKPYLDRNRDIVNSTSALIGLPGSMHEQKRNSGTWYTIRYARKKERKVTIVYPDGSVN